MSSKLRRRLIAVTGVIVIVIIAVLAVVQGSTGSRTVSVAEAASGQLAGQRVQVTGQVVDNSFTLEGQTLVFFIYDESDPATQLRVSYEGPMSATFGNQVTAICTGTMADDGTLLCRELVTKCPSKYESAVDALSVSQLLGYGQSVVDVPVKVSGTALPGSIADASATPRLVLSDPETGDQLPVVYTGGLPDQAADGATLVLTGSLDAQGRFVATDIALGQ